MEICEENILNQITLKSVCKVYSIAQQQGLNDLKQKAISFIKLHAKEIMSTDEYKELRNSNPFLVVELFEYIVQQEYPPFELSSKENVME